MGRADGQRPAAGDVLKQNEQVRRQDREHLPALRQADPKGQGGQEGRVRHQDGPCPGQRLRQGRDPELGRLQRERRPGAPRRIVPGTIWVLSRTGAGRQDLRDQRQPQLVP